MNVAAPSRFRTARSMAAGRSGWSLWRARWGRGRRREWSLPRPDRLRRRFLRGVGALGRRWESAAERRRAVECYERGLDVDDLAESLYQRLIVCYRRLGARAEALAVYRRCRDALASGLGVEPSPETEALHRALRAE